ncbi:MAG: shikimate dehydrogenase family protein [Aestuariivirga sp.]
MRSAGAATGNPEADPPGLPLPLTGRTSLFAVLGDPIAQAGSPVLFNSAFRRRGWPAVMVPLHVKAKDLAMTLRGLRGIGNLRGLVLTTPHKIAAVSFVDSIGAEARLVGSINAIRCGRDGRWHGENFDGLGCLRGLQMAGHAVAGRRILIVGTGGAGAAVAAAIAREGPASLRLHDIDAGRAGQTCAALHTAFGAMDLMTGPPDPEGFDIVINCTPLGMAGKPGLAVDAKRLAPGTVVADLVIEPEMTELLLAAELRGCLVHPGRRTLEGQVNALCAFFEGEPDG